MLRVHTAIILLLVTLAGCAPDLGECDELRAVQLVYDEEGSPAFEGQALMIQSCGFGAFCHAGDIPQSNRYGTPRGLEYDLRVVEADFDPEAPDAALSRLRAMHDRSFAQRHEIWDVVASGRMPIGGGVGRDVASAGPVYRRVAADGQLTPIATLNTSAGRDALRNWLACGLPIVQGTVRADDQQEPIGQIADALEVEPLAPRWSDIYPRLIERRCASAPCHGAAVAGDLDLRGAREAYDAMVGVASRADECSSTGALLIAQGDPDASLLVWKLTGVDASAARVCGDLMPVGLSRVSDASIDGIRQWITDGAPYDEPMAP